METFYFNLNGVEHNPAVKYEFQMPMSKKIREFYVKNPILKAFLNGCDKKDERSILNQLKPYEFCAGDRVIKRDSWDRSLLILAEGSLIQFNDESENILLTEGAIIGTEQFLFN